MTRRFTVPRCRARKALKRITQTALLCFLPLASAWAQTSNCVSVPSGLVGWWPGEGNTDDIQAGDNGTLQGGATFAPGEVGQAFSLNGTNAYVQAPDSSALDPTTAGSQ